MHPILFSVGRISIRSYGVMLVVGFLVGLWRAVRVSRSRGINPEQTADASLVALLSGIVGARLLYLLLNVPHEGWGVFREAHRIWEGGLSFHGGLAAAVIGVWVYVRMKKISFLALADLLSPSLALAYAFARIGCFLNGCCYGHATNLPWAVVFKDPASGNLTSPSHPSQLYAFVANLIIFWILIRIEKLNRPTGFIFTSYIALYSVYRFLNEFTRKGATAEVWFAGLTQAQVVSLLAIIVCGLILIRMNRRVRRGQHEEIT
jgi:phosphatidylglycerol:prolipoprotein diacylglycerol transferase